MNKKEFHKELATKNGKTIKEVEEYEKLRAAIIKETVVKDKGVKDELGMYTRVVKKGRKGTSKLHGVETPWKTEDEFVPKFKPNSDFKESIK